MLARLTALAAMIALSLVGGASVLASCAPPASVGENAARADAVVYGRVARINQTFAAGGNFILRVDRVLKGSAAADILVHVGPVPGTATSVDYGGATLGSEQTLYLRSRQGEFTTDACGGSHAGAPTADERAFFGVGTAPTASSPTGGEALASWVAPLGAALLVVAAALVAVGASLLRKRARVAKMSTTPPS